MVGATLAVALEPAHSPFPPKMGAGISMTHNTHGAANSYHGRGDPRGRPGTAPPGSRSPWNGPPWLAVALALVSCYLEQSPWRLDQSFGTLRYTKSMRHS